MNTNIVAPAAKHLKALLPPTCPVHLDGVTVEAEALELPRTTTAPSACCPRCATPSATVHSRYQRHLTDLPWGRLSVRIRLTVRTFVCHTAACARRIFTERLPALVAVSARRTCRLVAALRAIGMALGGNTGARLAARLRWPTSAATLLRLVRAAVVPPAQGDTQAGRVQLWREIQALGYTHSARTVCRFITQLRRAADAGHPPESQGSPYTSPQGPSARAVSFAMVCPAAKRSTEVQTYLDQLCQVDTHIARAYALSQAFVTLVRERRGEALEAWMAEAIDSGVAALARFARGLQDDLQAIIAGRTLEWSHGVTAGQIHRLKLLKRQRDGRAGVALLRQRILQVA